MITPILSVIVPTLNCADNLTNHINLMKEWLDLADEVIVVDSYSEDGTAEIFQERLLHSNFRFFSHPKGLYQSWNFGIQQTLGRWIYVSTIGDSITREQLQHLLATGEELQADVVVSPPRFVFESYVSIKKPAWPIHNILRFYKSSRPFVIQPLAAFAHAVHSFPHSILGSSASNIYRGEHLRSRPFPTAFQMAGDTAWAVRHALETRFCYTPRVGSVFRFHSETYTRLDNAVHLDLIRSLYEEGVKAICKSNSYANRNILNIIDDDLRIIIKYQQARQEWRLAKRTSRIPWYLRRSAIKSRNNCKSLKAELDQNSIRLENALKELPVQTAS